MTTEEIASRAEQLYQSRLIATVEAGNHGRYVAIDIDTCEYEVGDDRLTLSRRLRARRPRATVAILRIGFPAVGRMGARSRPVVA